MQAKRDLSNANIFLHFLVSVFNEQCMAKSAYVINSNDCFYFRLELCFEKASSVKLGSMTRTFARLSKCSCSRYL